MTADGLLTHACSPDPFAVATTISLQERRFRTLKAGDTFGVFDRSGDILPGPGSTEGLYHRDTRYLSRFGLLLQGTRPILLSSALRDDNGALTCDLTNPDIQRDGRLVLEHDLIHIRRSRFLWHGICHERIAVHNFSVDPQTLRLEISFDADFADLFEVRGTPRARHGRREEPEIGTHTVIRAYTGLDSRRRSTRLRFDPAPTHLECWRAVFDIALAPHAHAVMFIEVGCDTPLPLRPPRETFLVSMVEARRWMRAHSAQAAAIVTSNTGFNEAIQRSICDIYTLVTDKPTGLYPYAGVPWYSTVFGRDAIITGLQTLWLDPAISHGVLAYLARHQATELDAAADAEPGKILHEVRHGEMAELGEVPFRHYYGSVDSTPLFLMLAGAYLERTANVATVAKLWPHLEAALDWIELYGDRDGDGFVEYHRQTGEGLVNQGWKDSWDSVFHADGSLATGPIALCEVQGYVYAARRAMAAIARRLGKNAVAHAQEEKAAALRRAVETTFWSEELGTYALALDGAKRPCLVRASNAGHLLLCGLASPARAARVAEGLLSSAFFTGWGIRTVATTEARFNPMAYHNGSVWPHDNALIALGLSRYGHKEKATRVLDGLFEAALYSDQRRLSELFCGFPRRRGQGGPTAYPVACSPQAWAAAALPAMMQACLGISFDIENRTVEFDRPRLPASLQEVTLHNLAIDDARVSVVLRRTEAEVALNVLRRQGDIQVLLRS
ncbi:MAG TPA: glycogen debranching N-terminal domain-containing protein [Acetobacteraceae bacterium]|nr:glycogen debranching N-terminal domain-containing protein [Acetobacteraceae bacterium]